MTDDRFDQTPADEELLSAYLDGELSANDAEDFEQRLGREPDLAERLEALAGALTVLGGFDTAEPPEGFDERLSARIAAERSVPDLGARRAQRDRSRVWLGIGTAAAVVVLAAVMAGPLLTSVGGGGSSDLAGESAEVAVGSSEAAGADPQAPVLLDKQVAIANEQELRQRYETLPEADGLLGTPLTEAEELAQLFAGAARDADAFSNRAVVGTSAAPLEGSGGGGGSAAAGSTAGDDDTAAGDADGQESASESAGLGEPPVSGADKPERAEAVQDQVRAKNGLAPDKCLGTVTEGATEPLVPVRIETLVYDGRRALAYVFVTASPDADGLDRTELWVVRARNCATLVFQQY